MKPIAAYFNHAIKKGASDLHLVVDSVPKIRIDGRLHGVGKVEVTEKWLRAQLDGLLQKEQMKRFADELELDAAITVKQGRFRLNVHGQHESIGLAARFIPHDIPTPDELGFSDALMDMVDHESGLVLLVGATGSGKSSTLAAMLETINNRDPVHILTVEDPIEFVFVGEKALVEQRQVGTDTHSFAAALKHALRQDPDVIMVGEMRDPETIEMALTAAETGHLVFSTMHTATAPEAVERIVGIFEGSKQRQILEQLAGVLRGVVAQKLLPGADGGRVAAREILVGTSAVGNLIRQNNIQQLRSAMQTGAKHGMVTFDRAVKHLEDEGLI